MLPRAAAHCTRFAGKHYEAPAHTMRGRDGVDALIACAGAHAAVPDPERSSTTETGTYLLLDTSPGAVEKFRKETGSRVIDPRAS